MRLLHADRNTESIGHDGGQYERDEHGAFELPHELAEGLLERFPHIWSVAPEPVQAEPVKPRRGGKAKPADAEQGDSGQSETPADDSVSEEGDGDGTPAPEAPKGRASSRKASA